MNVLIVDDSILVRGMVKSLIANLDDFSVAGEAPNGRVAVQMTADLNPDLILMDINMPEMDGIEATGIIMRETPTPIVIFTSEDVAGSGFRAINNGAIEVVSKPDIGQINSPQFRDRLHEIFHEAIRYGKFRIADIRSGSTRPVGSWSMRDCRLVAIGASTGGPSAVKTVLSALPGNFPIPVVLTQHIEEGYDRGYAEWLNGDCTLNVRIASDGEPLVPGSVLVAPADRHLTLEGSRVRLDDGPRVGNQKPAVDKMFASAAAGFGRQVIGILLTGMGRDGADGCLNIINAGGKTLVQDEQSSMIFGMPKAAIELKAASEILPLDNIAGELIKRTES